VRFFSLAFYSLFGWRRKGIHHSGKGARDKICLNHFVTDKAYELSPPYALYWQELYSHLVPLAGPASLIDRFLKANADWVQKPIGFRADSRHQYQKSRFAEMGEWILAGKLGDWFERMVKKMQIRRIKRSIERGALGYKPRIRYSDEELEFHPDTRRIEMFNLTE